MTKKSPAGGVESLFRMDQTRLMRLLETAQYAGAYSVLGFTFGVLLDSLFLRAYPVTGEKELKTAEQFWLTVALVVAQVAATAVLVFYMRKIVRLLPSPLSFAPKGYTFHKNVSEFTGEVAMALVLFAAEVELRLQVERLRTYVLRATGSKKATS